MNRKGNYYRDRAAAAAWLGPQERERLANAIRIQEEVAEAYWELTRKVLDRELPGYQEQLLEKQEIFAIVIAGKLMNEAELLEYRALTDRSVEAIRVERELVEVARERGLE